MKRNSLFLVVLLALGIAMAASGQRRMQRRYIKAPDDVYFQKRGEPIPFSDGVLVGDTLYVAGHIGLDPKTDTAPADVELEARFLLDSIKGTLAQAGMTMDDLVIVQVHCPDLSLYDKFNAVYRTYFSKDLPARAFLGSGPLLRGGHFEMLGVAVKR